MALPRSTAPSPPPPCRDGSDRAARVGRALEFIEHNLGRPFSLDEAAAEAAWSLFHFHRIFAELVGIPPGGYLRARRLSEAARDLAEGRGGLRELALARGFGSPEAFSRSFAAHFGASPGEYGKRLHAARAMGPFLPVRRPLLGSRLAEVEILELPALNLAGLSLELPLDAAGLAAGTVTLWAAAGPLVLPLVERGLGRLHCVGFASDRHRGRSLRSTVAVELPPGRPVPEGLSPLWLPAGEYCRCLHRGPSSGVPESWLELYAFILPRMGRMPRGDFDFDRPLPGSGADGSYATELFVPLLPRAAS